jgi:hypothetical protein
LSAPWIIERSQLPKCPPSSRSGGFHRHPEFAADGKTVWRFFNAVTEAAKGSGLWALSARTQALHGLLDGEVGLFGDN